LKRAAGTLIVGFINTEVLKYKLHNRYFLDLLGQNEIESCGELDGIRKIRN
jgi:hypothetical protein